MGGQLLVAKSLAEMIGRVPILACLEIGESEVEPHPRQIGVAGEHGAEAGDGGLPVAPLGRDGAVQEVEIVDIPFARLDALEQKLRILQVALCQGLSGRSRSGSRAESFGRGGACTSAAPAERENARTSASSTAPNGLVIRHIVGPVEL